MKIVGKDFKHGLTAAIQYAVKVMSYKLHTSLFETCKNYGFCLAGLNIGKRLFIENDLLESLCVGICEWIFNLEKKFWDQLQELHKNNARLDMRNWLILPIFYIL